MGIRIGKRVRRDYAPLSMSQYLSVKTGGSSLMQTYDSIAQTFEPDRTLTPLVIQPVVKADATDGTWNSGLANSMLANLQWHYAMGNVTDGNLLTDFGSQTVPGTDIPLVEMKAGGADDSGMLTLRINVLPATSMRIWFTAILPDNRIKSNVPVKTDEYVLYTNERALEEISFGIGGDTNQIYDPFLDELYLYEWCVANGKVTPSAQALADAKANPNSYLRTLPLIVKAGASLATPAVLTACTVKVMEYVNSAWVEVQPGEELVSINRTTVSGQTTAISVTFDFRLIERKKYDIVLFHGGMERGRQSISFKRLRLAVNVRATNTAPFDDTPVRYDFALVQKDANPQGKILYRHGDVEVDCAEAVIGMSWLTTTESAENYRHNCGQRGVLRIGDLPRGGGEELETIIEFEHHPARQVATDGGVKLTNNGNLLLI